MEPSCWNAWLSETETDESSLIYQWEVASLSQGTYKEVVPPDHQLGTGLQQYSFSCDENGRSLSSHNIPISGGAEASAQADGGLNVGRTRRSQLLDGRWNFGDSGSTMVVADPAANSYITDSFLFSKRASGNDRLLGKQIMSEEALGLLVSAGSDQNREAAITRREAKKDEARGHVSPAQEHIMAERKRRERLNQKFIELSAIIPGLQKVDKASVLGGAVGYVKELQATVKALEDQNMKRTVESAVLVKRSQVFSAEEASSTDENLEREPSRSSLPEIEAKLSDNNVLIRIHCEKRRGVLVKALTELEMLHLTVTTTNVTPFLGSSIIITVTAQVEEEFSMTVEDLAKKLKSTLS